MAKPGPPFPNLQGLWEALIMRGGPYRDLIPMHEDPQQSLLDEVEARDAYDRTVADVLRRLRGRRDLGRDDAR